MLSSVSDWSLVTSAGAVEDSEDRLRELRQVSSSSGLRPAQLCVYIAEAASRRDTVMGDLYILNTRCQLTHTIQAAFEAAGLVVKVSTESGVSDENLRGAAGFTAICIFVNKKILAEQVQILRDNGNKLILHCSAGFDNSPTSELRAAGGNININSF